MSIKEKLIKDIMKTESDESIMNLKLSIDVTLSLVDSSAFKDDIEDLMFFSATLSKVIHDNFKNNENKKPQSSNSEASNH